MVSMATRKARVEALTATATTDIEKNTKNVGTLFNMYANNQSYAARAAAGVSPPGGTNRQGQTSGELTESSGATGRN